MKEKNVKGGEVVIKEGDDGDNLFVVESGTLTCTKVIQGVSTKLKAYQPGEAFGELALLYNAPRAATITADADCQLWELDRQTFNAIVKDSAAKKREKYEELMKNIPLLSGMDLYERNKIADAIKESKYGKGDYIIKEGEVGNTFFFINEGECIATKTLEPGQPPKEVMKYKRGDYFGEKALLKNEPRAANVIAQSDEVSVVYLDRSTFKRLLGPLEEILQRNMDVYNEYV